MKTLFINLITILVTLVVSGCCGKNGCTSDTPFRGIQKADCQSNPNNSERQECISSYNNSMNQYPVEKTYR